MSSKIALLLAGLVCLTACKLTDADTTEQGGPKPAASATVYEAHAIGRYLWVVRPGTEAAEELAATGSLAEQVTDIAAGPAGVTVKGPDRETVDGYLAWLAESPKFVPVIKGKAFWVLRNGTDDVERFLKGGGIGDGASRIGAGPGGRRLSAVDLATLDEWEASR